MVVWETEWVMSCAYQAAVWYGLCEPKKTWRRRGQVRLALSDSPCRVFVVLR